MVDAKKEAINYFFRLQGKKLETCHEPSRACTADAIRAHSIPSSSVLTQLAEDGHVVMPQLSFGAPPTTSVSLKSIGVNKATTFTGLCAVHDSSIFRPIDLSTPDCQNPEHLFLMAYRAVLREYHVVLTSALQVQANYTKQVDLGMAAPNASSQLGMFATGQLINAYESHEYKLLFDAAYLASDWSGLEHRVISLQGQGPVIAVSSMFSLDDLPAEETPRVTLTVFPRATGTEVVFSAIPRDAQAVFQHLDRLFAAQGHYQKYLLSKLILQSCDNFVLSPSHFEHMPAENRNLIAGYFAKTIQYNDEGFDDARLYLF
ncbi:MAG: hypothetical protein JNL18_06145 [Planctomycetaceae bacterium]|jgi:hypothetical protein|nr:hypothetical protein [Planctomycetaceae bacterium]